MAEKLSVQIALEGGAEIEKQLAGIGQAGQKAFTDITKAAEQAGGFRQLDPKDITAKLKELGTVGPEAINKITAAITSARRLETVSSAVQGLENRFSTLRTSVPAVGTAFANLFSASNKAGEAVRGLGEHASTTRAAVAALAQAANALGAGPLGRIATALANVGTRFGAIALPVAAIAGGSAALIKFAGAAEETQKALTQLQAVSGQSFEKLSALSNVFAQTGTPLKQFATEFGNLSEKIASAGEQAAKQDAISRQAEEAAKGLKVTSLGAITLDERVKALLETLSRVPPEQQWAKLADIFKGLSSDLERARIGKALGLSPESIATLSRGSAELEAMQQKTQQLGIALDALNQKNLGGLIQSQNTAGALFDAIKEKMGALVAPALTSFWDGFTARLQELIPMFTQIASSIGQMDFSSVGAAAADFLAVIAKIAAGWASMISGQVSLRDVLGQMLQQAGQIAVEIGMAIGTGIVQGIISSIQAGIGAVWEAIKSSLGIGGGGSPGGAPAPAAPGKARGGLLGGRGTGTSDSNLAWLSRGEYIMPASAVRQPGVLSFLEALRRGGGIPGYAEGGVVGGANVFNRTIDLLKGSVEALRRLQTSFNNSMANVIRSIDSLANPFNQAIDGIVQTIVQAADALQSLNVGGKARGGLLGGRGTGTSDSNLAWVSRGEHIMPARAVAQPGVLSFLEALRRSGGNLSRVLDGMGRFALGGMVPRAMAIPAFATGGLAGGMSNVTIQFPGLPAIGGLRASSDVVDQLHKAAALAQVRSGGRKPSRYS